MQILVLSILLAALLSHIPSLHATSTAPYPLANSTLSAGMWSSSTSGLVGPTGTPAQNPLGPASISTDDVLGPTAIARPDNSAPFSYQVPAQLIGLTRAQARAALSARLNASFSNVNSINFGPQIAQLRTRMIQRIDTLWAQSNTAVASGEHTLEDHEQVQRELVGHLNEIQRVTSVYLLEESNTVVDISTDTASYAQGYSRAVREDNWFDAVRYTELMEGITQRSEARMQTMRDFTAGMTEIGRELYRFV